MSIDHQKLLVATSNPGKVIELREMLSGLAIELVSLADLNDLIEVEETGTTFAANAFLKASGYALQTGYAALADDSGLEVAALDGRPGVLSARYAGDQTPFSEKMVRLLSELELAASNERTARFVCSIAIADKTGQLLYSADGLCEGHLANAPRGSGGFGYDPIFVPDGFDLTFGELSDAVKNQISHRARAFQQIIPYLRDFNAIPA